MSLFPFHPLFFFTFLFFALVSPPNHLASLQPPPFRIPFPVYVTTMSTVKRLRAPYTCPPILYEFHLCLLRGPRAVEERKPGSQISGSGCRLRMKEKYEKKKVMKERKCYYSYLSENICMAEN